MQLVEVEISEDQEKDLEAIIEDIGFGDIQSTVQMMVDMAISERIADL